jgi:hypothetical protein
MVNAVDATGSSNSYVAHSSRRTRGGSGMPDTRVAEVLDSATVERLSTAFNRCFETLEAPDDLFAPDVFCDLLPPLWRFQLQGPAALAAQLRAIAEGEPSARVLRVVPTATGFVMEHEETQRAATTYVARRLWLCEVRDGRITEVVGYCNGGWDDELRARHAAEAPMLRP